MISFYSCTLYTFGLAYYILFLVYYYTENNFFIRQPSWFRLGTNTLELLSSLAPDLYEFFHSRRSGFRGTGKTIRCNHPRLQSVRNLSACTHQQRPTTPGFAFSLHRFVYHATLQHPRPPLLQFHQPFVS